MLNNIILLNKRAAPELFYYLVRLASSLLASRLLLLCQRLHHQGPASQSARMQCLALGEQAGCCAAWHTFMGASFPASLATSFLAPAISFVVTCEQAVAVSFFDTVVQPLQLLLL